MSEIQQLQRVYKYRRGGKDHDLPDPNPEMSPNEVRKFYAARFSELANGNIEGPKPEGTKLIFTLTTNIGTKG